MLRVQAPIRPSSDQSHLVSAHVSPTSQHVLSIFLIFEKGALFYVDADTSDKKSFYFKFCILRTSWLLLLENTECRVWQCVVLFFCFADLNKALGNNIDAHEAAQMHQNFSQQLLQDHIAACSLPEHNLISVRSSDKHVLDISSLCTLVLKWHFFCFPVDWWPSSCPDPSSEWPHHQPRKPAMRTF